MLKYSAFLPIALIAVACGSSGDGAGDDDTPGVGGTSAGTSNIPLGGMGTSTGGTVGSGGSGGSGNASSGGSSNGIPPETADSLRMKACVGWASEPELLPTVLQVVLDTSLSMDERPRNSQDTKWEITRDALRVAIDGLPATTALGLLYYPGRSTQAGNPVDAPRDIRECVAVDEMIPIERLETAGSAHRDRLAESLDDAGPAGSTPTHDAYRYAYENGMRPTTLQGNRFMLLITDGAPTFALQCTGTGLPNSPSPTQPIIDDVLAARAEGVRTFIIGSPGTDVSVNGGDARPWMSEAAVLGDTARSGCSLYGPNYCHIDLSQEADFANALNAALARILGQIVSCSFELPTPSGNQTLNLDEINVIYSPGGGAEEQLIGRNDDPNCTDGWQLEDNARVVLCPNTCNLAQSNPGGTIELLFGCATQIDEPVR